MRPLICDLLVIGSGPAGEGAAMNAAKSGLKVVMVERDAIGGNSTHKGTIPSKALRHGVRKLLQANASHLFQVNQGGACMNFPNVLRQAASVVQRQAARKSMILNKNGIMLIKGEAKFLTSHLCVVEKPGEVPCEVEFKNALIATGSSPYRPSNIDFNHPRIRDSDTILHLAETPKKVIIYGAGVIGCEYASIFSGLGVSVDLVDTRDRLLSFLDDEISDALSYHLSDGNVVICHNEQFDSVEATDEGVALQLKSGRTIYGDVLLWCNGRTGNAHKLNLQTLGIEVSSRGHIEVDRAYKTSAPNIYAAGDIIGWPSLASASYGQGRAAVDGIIDPERAWTVTDVPTGIYTIPEISSVGKTEAELKVEGVPYEVGRASFKDMARAQISDEEVGMLKILFRKDTFQILGVHCFGYQASEIVHIGQAILALGGDLMYCVKTTFNYPTMAEAYREAALDGLSRLKRG